MGNMSEGEKRLRSLLGTLVSDMKSRSRERTVTEALRQLETLTSATHDAALEAAAKRIERAIGIHRDIKRREAACIRALKARPAERYLSEAEVRETLRGVGWDASEAARRLGVDLDAKGEAPPISGPTPVPFCPKCHHPAHLGACVHRNGGSANPCPCLYTSLPGRVAASKAKTECEGSPDCGWHNGGPCAACKARHDERCQWCGKRRGDHDAQGRIPDECGGFVPVTP